MSASDGAGLEPFRRAWTVVRCPPPPDLRVRRPAPRVRGRRVGRPGAARRGRAARARRARPRARDPARLRRRPAPGDARPRDRDARRPPARRGSSPPVLAALRLGRLPARCSSTACPRTPPSASRSSWPRRDAPRGAGLVNAVLRRAAREAPRAGRRAARRHARARPRCATRTRAGSRELWCDALGADAARALMAADNEPAEAALRANTLRTTAPSSRRALPVATPPGRRLPEGLVLDGAVRRVRARRCGSRALFMPQSRAAMAVARVLAPAARRARARPVRRARRQDDPPRRADGGPRARSSPSSATAGRADALRAHRRAHGRDAASRCAPPTPPSPHEPARFDRVLVDPPCSDLGTLAVAPRRALAQEPADRPRELAALQARDPARRRGRARGPAARSSTRPARSRPPRTSAWSTRFLAERAGLRGRRPARPTSRSGSIRPCRRYLQTLPHRDRTDGFFIARLRRARSRVSDDDVDLGDVCPACGEPWLRPTNLPGPLPLRELPAPLRAASRCARTAASTRRSCACPSTALYMCNHCRSSMLAADLMAARSHGVAPSILAADFARLGEQVGDGARRRRARDPRRRDGRPLRAADHDGRRWSSRRSPTRSTRPAR